MPRFAANLSLLFAEQPFLERFAAARACGFTAVEMQFPYAFAPAQLAEVMLTAEVEVVLFNLPAGDWAAGERGIACHPGRIDEFRAGVGRALDYARTLGCPRLNCLAGSQPAGVTEAVARRTLIENLRFAAAMTRRAGVELLLEPLNSRDVPGFLLPTPQAALALIAEMGSDNLHLQYDLYHAQIMAGDLTHMLETELPRIGHIQLADVPGRHEPGTGEINFDFLFARLDALGYAGWVGCEYQPSGRSEASLGWLARWR
ncbi:MAG: hydroxypyruvate isomerase [Betaproteobacteria bacterium HGW-Betaproteobacteria-11]|nr:MAG: hydroxypyruvate isomerase [Betaproteobacteria bacterium HGW-Betaproteobacteria-11]